MNGKRLGVMRLWIGAAVLCLLACGGNQSRDPADQIAVPALAAIAPYHLVYIDTAAIAAAVHAGRPVELPLVTVDDHLTSAIVRLTLRKLRNPALVVADVKNGVTNTFRTIDLPPPATYQGRLEDRPGAAIFTIDERVVEGNILAALPGGWSIIEPLEPQLRQRGVNAEQREELLKRFNHIVYNAKAQNEPVKVDADLFPNPKSNRQTPVAPKPVVVTSVADGDDAFYRAYPPDSVMPFWLKEETLYNALDWLFNCVEPEANSDNAFARCDYAFDGGSDGFRARVQLDRLETWEAGGPSSAHREALLRESARATHQATPPCCGAPHTAGRSSLVFFFSGRTLQGGAGVASVAGLAVYGDTCFSDTGYLCHHALAQLTPSASFPGNAFFQELLAAHEVGHILGGAEQPFATDVHWLFGQQRGPNLMGSLGFGKDTLYLYTPEDTHDVMGPLLQARLGGKNP